MTEPQQFSLDMDSDEVHADVNLLLQCSNRDILELISTDPKHYLEIVTRYTKRADGQEIFLPYLFNITIIRNSNEFRIKFKINDDSEWFEVGFAGGEFTDQDVYDAFKKKVRYALDRPSDHRALILDSLRFDSVKNIIAHPNRSPDMENQGDQTRLSKIDRYLNRKVSFAEKGESLLANELPDEIASEVPDEIASGVPDEIASGVPDDYAPISYSIDPVVEDSYKETEDSEVATPLSEYSDWFMPPLCKDDESNLNTTLDILKTICPDNMLPKYRRLLDILNSEDTFYESLIKELPYMTAGKRLLTTDFLLNNF